jgi:hypothetical protein
MALGSVPEVFVSGCPGLANFVVAALKPDRDIVLFVIKLILVLALTPLFQSMSMDPFLKHIDNDARPTYSDDPLYHLSASIFRANA